MTRITMCPGLLLRLFLLNGLCYGVFGAPESRRRHSKTLDPVEFPSITDTTENKTTEQPKITYSKQTIGKIGEEALLDCAVEGLDLTGVTGFSIAWNKIDLAKPTESFALSKGTKVDLFSTKYDIVHPNNTYQYSLKVKNLNEHDSGTYRCIVNFGDDQKISADVPLVIEQAAFFTDNFTKTLAVTEGDAISIDCQPGGYPVPDVYWERLNANLPYYGGKLLKANQLEIPDIQRQHKGHYVCHADNKLSDPVRSEIILEVQYKPRVEVTDIQVFAGPLQPTMLTCIVEAFPEPDVAWYKDDLLVLGSANTRVIKEPDVDGDSIKITLHIDEVTAEDYGQYVCRGVNIVGKTERTTNVSLKSPPRIVSNTDKQIIYDYTLVLARNILPIVLECEADGSPDPEYRWNKNGSPLVWQADSRLSLEPNTGNLILTDVTPADNGYYQCIAYNELGTAISDPIHLINSTFIKFKGIVEADYEVEAEVGRPFQLSCPEASGFPEPKLNWIKAYEIALGKEGETSYFEYINNSRSVVDDKGNLWISYVTDEDDSVKNEFKYLCIATTTVNPQDLSLATSVTMKVIHPLDGTHNGEAENINIESFPMYVSPEEQIFQTDQENRLWCIYGGEPTPGIVWVREDGQAIDETRAIIENSGRTLVFMNVDQEDTGMYQCSANNGVGDEKSHLMKVDFAVVPKFTKEMASQTVHEGTTVSFTCEVNSTSDMEYKWYFNGRQLGVSPGSKREVLGAMLKISKVSTADIGNYACNATSDIGHAYGQAVLNVISAVNHNSGGTQCANIQGITEELSNLRQTILEMNLMVQQQRQTHDQTMINLMQRIAAVLPEKPISSFLDQRKEDAANNPNEKEIIELTPENKVSPAETETS